MVLNYGRERHEAFVLKKKPSAAPKQALRITESGRVKAAWAQEILESPTMGTGTGGATQHSGIATKGAGP